MPNGSKYSNLGFNLLAQIVAAYGGQKSYESYVQTNIFDKLGMLNSFYKLEERQAKNLAISYGRKGSLLGGGSEDRTPLTKVTNPGAYSGSIGLNISSLDLSHFGKEILRWTTSISKNNLAVDWQKAIFPVAQLGGMNLAVANGFLVYIAQSDDFSAFSEGVACYGHTGTNHGAKALLYVCPELDWGVAVLGNTRDSKRNEYLFEIGQMLVDAGLVKKKLSKEKALETWLASVSDFQDSFSKPIFEFPKSVLGKLGSEPYATGDYVGVYHSDTDGPMNVNVAPNGRLTFLGAELLPDSIVPDRFYNASFDWFDHTGEAVDFIRDQNGKVVKVIAYSILHAEKVSE